MRIISKFQDFYDSALGYGIDPNCIYVRATSDEDFAISTDNHYCGSGKAHDVPYVSEIFSGRKEINVGRLGYTWDNLQEIKYMVFLFCGKVYPCIKTSWNVPSKGKKYIEGFVFDDTTEVVFSYSEDDVAKAFDKHGSKKDKVKYTEEQKGRYSRPSKWYPYADKSYSKKTEMFFERSGVEAKELMDMHYEKNIPVFLFSEGKLISNPCMKEHQFYKAVDSFQAFQELSMFISGVLGGQSPKMVEISNDMKIHKAGFDIKKSFRTRKV